MKVYTAGALVLVLGFQIPVFADQASIDCANHLRTIGKAMHRFSRANKHLPDQLQDLYPRYVSDKELFLCPADNSSHTGAANNGQDQSFRTSYLYEMSGAADSSGSRFLGPGPKGSNLTWRDVKVHQRIWFGDRVPVIRCRHHPQFLNLTLNGDVYASGAVWESDPSSRSEVLSSLIRDLHYGRERYQDYWDPNKIVEYLRSIGDRQRLEPGFQAKMRGAAERAANVLVGGTTAGDATAYFLSGALFYLGGDLERALQAFDKSAAREPDSTARAAVNNLGEIYIVTSPKDKPIRFYRRLIESFPGEPAFYRRLADAYGSDGQTSVAARWREAAGEIEAARQTGREVH